MVNMPQFMIPRTGERVSRIGQNLQSFITSIPQRKQAGDEIDRQNKLIEQAAQAAKTNWEDMNNAYKGVKSYLNDKLTPLVQDGTITEQEKNDVLQRFRMPSNIDKKDPKAYLIGQRETLNSINKEIANKMALKQKQAGQQQVSGVVGEQLLGKPGTPMVPGEAPTPPTGPEAGMPPGLRQAEALPPEVTGGRVGQMPIPGTQPAKTFEEAGQGVAQSGLSQEQQQQAMADPRIKGLQTEEDIWEQKMKERKQDEVERHNKEMERRGHSKDTISKTNKPFLEMLDERNRIISNINKIENRKKGYTNLKNKVQNKNIDELKDFNTQQLAQDMKISMKELLSGDQRVLDMIDFAIAGIEEELSTAKREKQQVITTMRKLADNPEEALAKLFVESEVPKPSPPPKPATATLNPARAAERAPIQSPGATKAVVTPKQQQAIDWLKANPNDPRAPAIKAKLQREGAL